MILSSWHISVFIFWQRIFTLIKFCYFVVIFHSIYCAYLFLFERSVEPQFHSKLIFGVIFHLGNWNIFKWNVLDIFTSMIWLLQFFITYGDISNHCWTWMYLLSFVRLINNEIEKVNVLLLFKNYFFFRFTQIFNFVYKDLMLAV